MKIMDSLSRLLGNRPDEAASDAGDRHLDSVEMNDADRQTGPHDTIDGLDDLLGFEPDDQSEQILGSTSSGPASGTFVAIANLGGAISDDEVADWHLDLSPAQIAGEGITPSVALPLDRVAEHDFLKVGNRGRQSVKRVVVQATTRLSINPESCITWSEEALAKGWYSFEDIEALISHCEGNGDLDELCINIRRNLEAVGLAWIDHSSGHDAGLWDAGSNISANDIAEAIEAALTRATRLPGTRRFVMSKSEELRLLEPVARAEQEFNLCILACETAVTEILDVVDSVFNGHRDPGSVSLRNIIPGQQESPQAAAVLAAAETLKFWHAQGRVMDGKRRREALAALGALDLSPAFHMDLVRSLKQQPTSLEHAIRLDELISKREAAIESLICAHLPYVRRFASRNVEEGEDPEDVFQIAFMGLQRSARRFDPELGVRFVVYCALWMRQSLTRWRADERELIRLPANLHENLVKIDSALDKLDLQTDGIVSDDHLADELGWTVSEVQWFREIPRGVEYPENIDDWDNLLSGNDDVDVLDQIAVKDIVRNVLDELPKRQADVIRMRFGIGYADEMTLEEISRLYGVTRERIRQVESKALDALSNPGRMRRLRVLLGR